MATRLYIDQSNAARDEWTEFDVRMCLKGGKTPAVEMHVEHYRKEFDRKQGRAHATYPVLTVEQAARLRSMLDAAIAEASARYADGGISPSVELAWLVNGRVYSDMVEADRAYRAAMLEARSS